MKYEDLPFLAFLAAVLVVLVFGCSGGGTSDTQGGSTPTPTKAPVYSLKVNWTRPTLNVNGSPIGVIGFFRVSCKPAGQPAHVVMSSGDVLSAVVSNISAGSVSCTVTTINAAGEESDPSGTLVTKVP